MKMLAVFVILLTVRPAVSSTGTDGLPAFHHVSFVSSEQLDELKQSPSMSAIYFLVQNTEEVRQFLDLFDKSAEHLKAYNITLAVFDCISGTPENEMCKMGDKELHVYMFRDGNLMVNFFFEEKLDVDSVVAQFLQLDLLKKVPIIQSQNELHELQKQSRKNKVDIIVAFLPVFGGRDHRIFLEAAYGFLDRFQFAWTIHPKLLEDVLGSENPKLHSFAVWTFFCTEPDMSMFVHDLCPSVLYPHGAITTSALATFFSRLLEKTLYHASSDDLSEVFNKADNPPLVFVYINKEKKDQASHVIDLLEFQLRGVAKVIVVDMDNEISQSLARQHGFTGNLPAIGIKMDGGMMFMEKSTEWSSDNVLHFINSLIFPANIESPVDNSPVTEFAYFELVEDEMMVQDDQIASAVSELNAKDMELDHVPALLKNNFNHAVTSADLMLVLFYFPFDHLSMAFLREFGHAAQTLATDFSITNVLARVNCFDGTDVCAAENITTYPVLRIFRGGKRSHDYRGSLDARSVIKAVKLLQLNGPIHLTSEQQVIDFIKGEYPQPFFSFTPSSVLLLAAADDSDEATVFNNVARKLSTKTAFGVVHGDLSRSVAKTYKVSVPSVMAFHRSDENYPIRVLQKQVSESTLTELAENSLVAKVPKLTIMNLPVLFAKKLPFAILFLDQSDPTSKSTLKTFTEVALDGQFDMIIFCWMHAHAETLGQKILSMYTKSATLPMITLVDHAQGVIFNYQPEQIEKKDTVEWLTRVLTGAVKPSKKLEHKTWGPPGHAYDFLAMMDKEKEGHLAHPSRAGIREIQIHLEDEINQEAEDYNQIEPQQQTGDKEQHFENHESLSSHGHPHVEL